MGEGVSGGRVYGSGGQGTHLGLGGTGLGSGCVWVWLPTSGICRLASLGRVVVMPESVLSDGAS